MAYDIGMKLGIDGEPEFRKAIAQINDNIKTLGTEMSAVTSSFDDNDKSAEKLTAQNKVLEKQIEAQADALKYQTEMLEKSRAKYGENSAETKSWERVVNNSTATLNKLERQLGDNKQALDDLDNAKPDVLEEVAKDAEKAGNAFSLLEKSSENISAMFDVVKVAAGNLIAEGISTLISGLGQALSAFVNLDETTEEYRVAMGKINTAFESAGFNAETAQESYEGFYRILGDTDTAAEASQLLAQLAETEEDVSKWTEISAGVYGRFGDAIPINGLIEAANETAKVGEITGALADALNWVGISEDEFNESLAACSTESERTQLIMETLTDAYRDSSEAFYENNSVLISARENQAALDEVTGRLGATVANVKNELLAKFGPAIVEIGNSVADFIEGVNIQVLFEKFESAWGEIQKICDTISPYFSGLRSSLDGVFSTLGEMWFGDLTDLQTGITASLSPLGNDVEAVLLDAGTSVSSGGETLLTQLAETLEIGISELFHFLVTGITEGIPLLASAAADIVNGVGQYIRENIPVLMETGLSMVSDLLSALMEASGTLLEAGLSFVDNVATGILDGIPGMIEKLPQVIDGFLDFITDQLPTILEKGKDLLNNMCNGVLKAIPAMLQRLPEIITSFVGFITANLPTIVNAGGDILGNLVKGVIDYLPEIGKSAVEIIAALVNGILSLKTTIEGIGSDIISGVFNGIMENAAWFGDQVFGFFSGVVDGVKSVLGIHSPSRVFADIGKNMVLGLDEGFHREMSVVRKNIDQSLMDFSRVSQSVTVQTQMQASVTGQSESEKVINASELREAMSGMGIYMNGRKVGNLVTMQQALDQRANGS